jgi:TonB family protein
MVDVVDIMEKLNAVDVQARCGRCSYQMRKFIFVFIAGLLCVCSILAQAKKSDREDAGLKGKVKTVFAQDARLSESGGQWIEDNRLPSYEETYDEQGNITKRLAYDYRGNLRDTTIYTAIDGQKTSKWESIHHDYDPPPAMAPPSSGTPKPRDPRFDNRYVYKYDSRGNRTEETLYKSDGSQGNRNVTTFDDKGNKVKWEHYTAEGELNFSNTSKFDSKGNLIEVTYYHANGTISSKYSYADYVFDTNGNWTKRKTLKWTTKDGQSLFEPYQITYRTITYYNSKNAAEPSTDSPKGSTIVWIVPPGKVPGVPFEVIGQANPSRTPPPGIVVKTGTLEQGQAITRVEPKYPAAAKAAQLTGVIQVEVIVDEQGNVIYVRTVSGHPLFREAAEEAARQWKFAPSKFDGVPVKILGGIVLNFRF